MKVSKKVLIISISGIWNTILQSPMINAILENPGYQVDILFWNRAMAWVYQYETKIKEKFILSDFLSIRGIFALWIKMLFKRYDYSVSCFPSRRVFFNIFPLLCFIKYRCVHSYKGFWFWFLSNRRVSAHSELHDVEQNLNLLPPLDIEIPFNPKTYFWISVDDMDYALKFMTHYSLRKENVIGIHPGSGPLTFKRWESYKYKQLINKLISVWFKIILFGTWSEREDYRGLQEVYFFDWNINQTGALISCCRFFVSGDTGLMHIAAYFGIEQVVVWKWTSFSRTTPKNKNAKVIFVKSNSTYNYPFN